MISTFRSFAKINLTLELVARRADGYHELRTLFQTIDLADEIELELTRSGGEIELRVEGAELPAGEGNLGWRAARGFLDLHGDRGLGVRLRIRKRIPLGAGLGGGSANAATVLLALEGLVDAPPPRERIRALAARLGADVPYFLVGGTALGLGRGDEIRPLDDPARGETELQLALPPWSLATAEVYGAVRLPAHGEPRAPSAAIASAMAGRRAERHEEWIGPNDLEEPAFRVRPEQAALYTSAVRSGARIVRMSGSGSALFALYDDPEAARAAKDHLPSGTVWQKVSTLGRAAWRRASGLTA